MNWIIMLSFVWLSVMLIVIVWTSLVKLETAKRRKKQAEREDYVGKMASDTPGSAGNGASGCL